MSVALTTTPARCENDALVVLGNLADYLSCFGVFCNRAKGHINYFIFAVCAGAILFFTRIAISRDNMLSILKVQQRPMMRVAPKNYMTSASTVTTIRTTFLNKLFSVEMQKARTTTAGS